MWRVILVVVALMLATNLEAKPNRTIMTGLEKEQKNFEKYMKKHAPSQTELCKYGSKKFKVVKRNKK